MPPFCRTWVSRPAAQSGLLSPGGDGSVPAQIQEGVRPGGLRPETLQGVDLGDFLFGVLNRCCFITWRQYPQALC